MAKNQDLFLEFVQTAPMASFLTSEDKTKDGRAVIKIKQCFMRKKRMPQLLPASDEGVGQQAQTQESPLHWQERHVIHTAQNPSTIPATHWLSRSP